MIICYQFLECLTISSDEEEGNKMKKTESNNSTTNLCNASNASNEDVDTILDKEPVITYNSVFVPCDDSNEEESEGNVS